MSPSKCPNCRLSLPQNWAGMNDPNGKCPYCGKPLVTKTAAPGTAPPAPPAPPTPAAPALQPAARPAGGAKTILWGAGLPLTNPMSKPGPEERISAPLSASIPPAPSSGNEAFFNASTQNRKIIAEPASALAAPVAFGTEGANVNGAGHESPSVSPPAMPQAKINQPSSPTVMFESPAREMESSLASMERIAPEPEPIALIAAAAPPETKAPTEPISRPTPTRSKLKDKKLAKKGFKSWSGTAPRKGVSENGSGAPKSPSSKTPILLIIAAVATVVLISVGVIILRGKGKRAGAASAKDVVKTAEPIPSQAEPAPNEEPAALAPKPAPAEATKPAQAEGPVLADKPSQADKPTNAEKSVHTEKAAPAEKPKVEAAPPEPKIAGGKPSEDDYRRANEVYERGNAKLFQGNTADAIADFNQALNLNPKDPAIHRGLGLAYAQSGQSADAIKHLKLYLKASPKATDRAIIEKRIAQLRRN